MRFTPKSMDRPQSIRAVVPLSTYMQILRLIQFLGA